MRKKIIIMICAICFALACMTGYFLETNMNDINILILGIVDALFFIIVYFSAKAVLPLIMKLPDKSKVGGVINSFFESRTYLKVFIILLVVWLPIVFIRYPGIQEGGLVNQFRQFMGMDTLARSLSPVVYKGHYITGHHPVFLTFVFGAFIKFGVAVGNVDIGMFLLSIAICILNATGWAYVISCMRLYLKSGIWRTMLICFAVNPLIISLNTYVLKDNLFATLLAVYCVVIFRICQDGMQKKYRVQILICSLLLPFVKNQGIYIILISNFILILYYKKEYKVWIKNIVLSFFLFGILLQNVFMPLMKIAPGGKQEMLSLFFQATARTVLEHHEQIDTKEMEIVRNVLPVDDWNVYEPLKSDNIKFNYNQNAAFSDLINYFGVWVRWALRYPESYMNAFIAQTYGYYYIDFETIDWNWDGDNMEWEISPDGNTISEPKFTAFNSSFSAFTLSCIVHERYKYMFNVASAFWVIIMCCLIMWQKKDVLWITPVILQWVICLASPVCGSGRYGMIIYEMMPVIIAVTFGMRRGIYQWDTEGLL